MTEQDCHKKPNTETSQRKYGGGARATLLTKPDHLHRQRQKKKGVDDKVNQQLKPKLRNIKSPWPKSKEYESKTGEAAKDGQLLRPW